MRGKQRSVGQGIIHLILMLVCLAWILPTLGLLVSSVRPASAVSQSGWWTVFANPFDLTQYTLANYKQVLNQDGMGRSFVNSVLISLPATLLPLLVGSAAAYAFSRLSFKGKEWLFLAIIGLLVVPIQMTMIPILRLYSKLGVAGTFAGLWLAHTAYGLPFAVYLMRNFFHTLPDELFEAAYIDGAGHLRAFFVLALPMSVAALASLGIFQFLWVWNDLLVALIYLGGTQDVAPLTVKLSSLVGSYGQGWHLLTAAAFVAMALPLVIFFALQRFFVRGILAGSVKG